MLSNHFNDMLKPVLHWKSPSCGPHKDGHMNNSFATCSATCPKPNRSAALEKLAQFKGVHSLQSWSLYVIGESLGEWHVFQSPGLKYFAGPTCMHCEPGHMLPSFLSLLAVPLWVCDTVPLSLRHKLSLGLVLGWLSAQQADCTLGWAASHFRCWSIRPWLHLACSCHVCDLHSLGPRLAQLDVEMVFDLCLTVGFTFAPFCVCGLLVLNLSFGMSVFYFWLIAWFVF